MILCTDINNTISATEQLFTFPFETEATLNTPQALGVPVKYSQKIFQSQ